MAKKPFPFSVCEQCCGSGDVSQEQIEEAVENYFEENPDAGSGMNPDDYYTAKQLDEYFEEQEAVVAKKTEETILYEDVVNAPEWTKQPTVVSGEVVSVFSTNDFYYVTLKDASGNALPSGQFMLKNNKTTNATVYSVVFSLANLYTGADTLVENFPIEFTSIGIVPKMRNAGVWMVEFKPSPTLDLFGNKGTIKIETFGQFIQRGPTAYFISSFKTNGKVSHYHSNESSAFQNASTQQIVPYMGLSSYSYGYNLFHDECILKKCGNGKFFTQRNLILHMMKDGTTGYSRVRFETHGIGTALQENVAITVVNIQVAVDIEGGVIRNGSIIRVTEVK